MSRRQNGMTLVELLVVMLIMSVLTTLAVSAFHQVQSRTKACEAKGMLKAALVMEKAYLNQHSLYSASLEDIGFVQDALVTDQPPGVARYRMAIPVATRDQLQVTATSVLDFDGDGQYSVWIIDQEGIIRELVTD